MRHKRTRATHKRGYCVLTVPDDGLFFKNGRMLQGSGTEMRVSEIVLFTRYLDAAKEAKSSKDKWPTGYSFPVIPVIFSERN